MNKPVLVAPGWSYEKAVIASKYWAEDVYIWVPFTSLRMRQNKVKDFSELKKTIDALHQNGSRALLTMNIFPRNSDIKVFESVSEQIADTNPDAIIFSDPWTFNVLRKYFPNTHLHLSTQASTLNYESIKFWRDLGVKRIVLARELHINEIKEIKEHVPDIELEVFVHWAMCMSYSGRCVLWDYMNWRQANKWECSHNCRFKYKVRLEEEKRPGKLFQMEWDENWTHILSSKDLCTIDRLAEIIPYVDAMKIEWRSKSEFYVWSMVKAYKHVRDCIIEWKEINPEIKSLVEKIPHRPYWDWFLFNKLQDYPEWEVEWRDNVISKEQRDWEIHNINNGFLPSVEMTNTKWDIVTSTNLASPWPTFCRNYFWIFGENFIEKDWKKYYEFTPKEVIERWMELKYLSANEVSTLKIVDIVKENWKELESANCNMSKVYILTDKDINGREILYE